MSIQLEPTSVIVYNSANTIDEFMKNFKNIITRNNINEPFIDIWLSQQGINSRIIFIFTGNEASMEHSNLSGNSFQGGSTFLIIK